MALVPQTAFDIPAYNSPQAAHYVGVPLPTLRQWVGADGLVLTPKPNLLSFNNLMELHVLKAMRRMHHLSLQSIRKALQELATLRQTAHPLLDESFATDGLTLCIREGDQVLNLNRRLQQEIKEFVDLYLQRIERDAHGRATRLYPFIVQDLPNEPKSVSISPVIAFGRPVVAGTGIATAVIAGRFAARDSLEDLAQEYAVEPAVLEDAIRWEMLKGKAA